MYGCENNSMFAVRALMSTIPLQFVSALMVVCITFFGQAVRLCESPTSRINDDQDFSDFINSMWCVIVTMTTVGFGDIYPKTMPGRIVIFLVSLVGVVIVSIVVVTI
jgi:hypothetical protein